MELILWVFVLGIWALVGILRGGMFFSRRTNAARLDGSPVGPRTFEVLITFQVLGVILYLSQILIVLFYPEVMMWLGLDPYVRFLTSKIQPGGFDHVASLVGPELAHDFFRFHAASQLHCILLAIGVLVLTNRVLKTDGANPFPSTVGKSLFVAVSVVSGIAIFTSVYLPYMASLGGKFSIQNRIGLVYVVYWATTMIFVNMAVSAAYACIWRLRTPDTSE